MADRDLNQKGVEELEAIVQKAVAGRDESMLVEVDMVLARRSVSRSVELRRIVRGILADWQRGRSSQVRGGPESASQSGDPEVPGVVEDEYADQH